jgi:hypothetical protein
MECLKQHGLVAGFVILCAFGLGYWYAGTGDGLGNQAPDTLAFLIGEKTRCEQYARKLNKRGTANAEDEYEKVELANKKCVAYLKGIVGGRTQKEAEVKNRLDSFGKESDSFCNWADRKLDNAPIIGAGEPDLAKLVKVFLDAASAQDKERRDELRRELEPCEFRRWDEIISRK